LMYIFLPLLRLHVLSPCLCDGEATLDACYAFVARKEADELKGKMVSR